ADLAVHGAELLVGVGGCHIQRGPAPTHVLRVASEPAGAVVRGGGRLCARQPAIGLGAALCHVWRLHPFLVPAVPARQQLLYPLPVMADVNAPAPDVLVLGSSPTGLYALREAAEAGLRVGLADTGKGCAFASRYPVLRFCASPEGLRERLQAWRDAGHSPLLLPTSDFWIEAVMAGVGQDPGLFRSFPSYAGVASQLLDKLSFHALCQQHGMAVPGLWRADGPEQLAALADQLSFPCILKPALIHRAKDFLRGEKVLLAKSRKEYLAHVAHIPPGSGDWFVQEI